MEYTYENDGKLKQLDYLQVNEAGATLRTRSSYQYSTNGDLQKIVTVDNSFIITHVIEAYSEPVDFNPMLFIETGLFENYPLYNYAVMSRLKKIPSKILRLVKNGAAPEFTDKIQEIIVPLSTGVSKK